MNTHSPKSLTDCIISNKQSRWLLEAIMDGRAGFPGFQNTICLHGTYGTGKTTLANKLPHWMEAEGMLSKCPRLPGPHQLFSSMEWSHFQPCGAGTNSVTLMLDIYKRDALDLAAAPSGWHYEVLDEVDLLTPAAQASLKAATTDCTNTIFLLTTNHLSKLDRGLQDRSVLIEMNQPPLADMVEFARTLVNRMGVDQSVLDDATLEALASASRGSIRQLGQSLTVLARRNGSSQ
jgi:DNA polymerase III delta prime subunit